MPTAMRMTRPAPEHLPVMLRETLEALAPGPDRTLLDGTIGLGGHAAAWLERSAPGGRVVGFDRDISALAAAGRRLAGFGSRVLLVHDGYENASDRLRHESVDAVLLDLGLGSHQLADAERGFSFRLDGPLDMRFDRDRPGRTAAELLARTPMPDLARLFAEFGEIRGARKLARVICEERQREPIRTTTRLAEIVRRTLPSRSPGRSRVDPATQAFQALRIAVNDEIGRLERALTGLLDLLRPGGRIAVISFHSLEDRLVKRTFRRLAAGGPGFPGDPDRSPERPRLDLGVRRPVRPSGEEIAANPRARSARLRWGIRL